MKKILLLSIIFVSVILSSCKKESSSNNIFYKQVNITVTANKTISFGSIYGDSIIYINNDKFPLKIWQGDFDYIQFGNGDFNSNIEFGVVSSKPKVYNLNEVINELAAGGWNMTTNTYGTGSSILPGNGDKYIAFRIKPDENVDKSYYGWMKLNYASNGKSITLIEYAYNQNVNESIKVGQK
jgi:hypothetical protein